MGRYTGATWCRLTGGHAHFRALFSGAHPPRLLWLLPGVVVVEFVGSTFGHPFAMSLLFLAAVAGLLLEPAPSPRASSQPAPAPWGAALALLGLVLIADPALSALTPRFGYLSALGRAGRLMAGLSGAWALVVGGAWLFSRSPKWKDFERLGLLLALVFLCLMAGGTHVQRLTVFPVGTEGQTLAVILSCVLIGLGATPSRWQSQRFAVLLCAGLALRITGLRLWQPNPVVRDMLPLIQSAGEAFVDGHSPYGLYQMQRGSVVPLTYLPGMWVLHDVPTWLGLPLRSSSLLFGDVGFVVSLWWAASGYAGPARRAARSVAMCLAAVWWFSPSVQWNAIYAEPHVGWGLVALTLATALRGHLVGSALCLGMALATRHFAWVLAPFWFLWMLRAKGPGIAAAGASIALSTAVLWILPFAVREPDLFWFGTLRWFTHYGPAHRAWFLERLGFAGTLYAHSLEGWIMPLGGLLVAACLVVAWRSRSRHGVLVAAALAYTFAVMCSPVIWDSFYLGCFVVLCLVTFGGKRARFGFGRIRRSPASLRSPVRLAWVVSGAGLVWLVLSFVASGGERGLVEAASALERLAQPGDLLVDRSRRRVAFVQPPLALTDRPGMVVAPSAFDARLPELGVLTAPRLGLLFRSERERSLAKKFRRLGSTLDEGLRGDYGWLVVDPVAKRERLGNALLGAAFRPSGGTPVPLEPVRPGRYRTPLARAIDVRRKNCGIGGRSRFWWLAHPSQLGTLELSFGRPNGFGRLALLAGFEDPVVVWDRADAQVTLRTQAKVLGRLHIDNLPGVQWDVFEVPQDASHSVRVDITTVDDRQRWLCLDGIWL